MAYSTTNDGVKLYYEERGSGKPLVLIHGWSCSGNFFTRNVESLSSGCRVINVDLRGHGRSDKPTWGTVSPGWQRTSMTLWGRSV
jgi:non-heme chloroperoxidase